MKIPKVISSSLLQNTVSKLINESKLEVSQENSLKSQQITLDLIDLTDNSIILPKPEDDKLPGFLSEDISIVNNEDQTPSFNSTLVKKTYVKELHIEPQHTISCVSSKSNKTHPVTLWGIPVVVGILGVLYLTKKKR